MPVTSEIFVALSTFAQEQSLPLDVLQSSGFSFSRNSTGRRLNRDELIVQARGARGVIAGLEPYDRAVLEQLPDLRCISRCGVGVDNVDLIAAREHGIMVLNTPEVVVQPVAELTVGLMLDLLRKITFQTERMRAGAWDRMTGGLLKGRRVGLIGLGRIGRRVAQLVRAFEAEVCAYDVHPDSDWAKIHGVELMSLSALLGRSDIVSLHLAVDAKSPFLLDAKLLAFMKKGSLLVNVSRGQLVDEAALFQALQSGNLAGAGLDVFVEEPYTGPLSRLPHVIMTPHIGTMTSESRVHMELEAVENLVRFLKNHR